jgi:hypothetical protein
VTQNFGFDHVMIVTFFEIIKYGSLPFCTFYEKKIFSSEYQNIVKMSTSSTNDAQTNNEQNANNSNNNAGQQRQQQQQQQEQPWQSIMQVIVRIMIIYYIFSYFRGKFHLNLLFDFKYIN